MKFHLVGYVGINMLLVGELDVKANTATAGFIGAAVSGFHNAWAASGNDGVTILGKFET